MISKEIISFDADVICLQEVDKRDLEFFKSILQSHSFSYVKKPHSSDGTCILIRNTFELINVHDIIHTNPEQDNAKENLVSLVVEAKNKENNVHVIVASTHLKADNFNAPCTEKRMRQVKQIIEVMEQKKENYHRNPNNKKENLVLLVCGDFNDNKNSKVTQEFLQNKDFNLKSAFHDIEFTIFQSYGHTENSDYVTKNTIDYVMHSENLTVVNKISSPKEEMLRKDGLLSENFPSDHLSLFCTLSL